MDFSWTPEQLAYKQRVIDFAQTLNADFIERERNGTFSKELWQQCAQFGVLGLAMPRQYGGSEAGIYETILAMEGLGYGWRDIGIIFGMNAQLWSVQMPILSHGTPQQKQDYLPPMIRGDLIGAHAMSEPDSGSDAYSMKSTAVRSGDGYILNGSKTYITSGPVADFYVVFANAAPEKGMWGVTAFLLDRNTPGLDVHPVIDKMGLRTIPMGSFDMHDCYLPSKKRLGPEGAGAQIFAGSMEWERSCILASNIGAMEYQLETAIQYARSRKQFKQPIGNFQSVANRIVDMKVRLETARLMLYKIAWLIDQGKNAALDAAIAKLYLSEVFVESSLDAIRVHGAPGILTRTGVDHELRDSIGGLIYSGTSDIQRNIIARLIGL
jgi:alkylation response protein AidB-like acyl-CoA dehydrogenase